MGPRDVEQGTCVVARRDVAGKEGKQFGVPLEPEAFVAHVNGLLEEIQDALLAQARAFRDENIVDVTSYEELQAAVAAGACGGRAGWGGVCQEGVLGRSGGAAGGGGHVGLEMLKDEMHSVTAHDSW